LLGKHEDFVDSYIEETKESGAMTEQRYQEAVAFAQKATFLDNSVPGKPAASVKSNGAKRTKAA